MMGITHMTIGAAVAALALQTANPALLLTGAIASLLPDIDISISPAGRVFPWVSRWLESRGSHRSCTHSLVASAVVALVSLVIAYFKFIPLEFAKALTIGYTAGWLADLFTKSGVEMFYPSPVRWVCPGNRNLRLATGSNAEYGILVILVALTLWIFQINSNGGIFTQFNRLIGSTTGVQALYNEQGGRHLITAHIKGVKASDRSPVNNNFTIISAHGSGFLVMAADGSLYKAGTDGDVQIIAEHITGNVGPAATTQVESVLLEEESLTEKLNPFNGPGAMVFVSGSLKLDDPQSARVTTDPHQFHSLKILDQTATLDSAPLTKVLSQLGDQFVTGQLSIRSIYSNAQTFTPSNSQTTKQSSDDQD